MSIPRSLAAAAAAIGLALTASAQVPVYVSPSGSDATGDGSESAPYRSITKALAENTQTAHLEVHAAAGLYDAANGETFPISPASSQSILGVRGSDPGSAAGSTVIDAGGAAYAIQLPYHGEGVTARLAGVAITNALSAIRCIAWRGDIDDVLVTDVAQGETYSMLIYGDNAGHAIHVNRMRAVNISNPATGNSNGGRHAFFFLAGGGELAFSDCVFSNIAGGFPEWGFFHVGWHGGSSWTYTVEGSLFEDISYAGGNNDERSMIQCWGGGSKMLFDRNIVRNLAFDKYVLANNRCGQTIIRNSLFENIAVSGGFSVIGEAMGGGQDIFHCTFHNCSPVFRTYNGTSHIYVHDSILSHDTSLVINSGDASSHSKLRFFDCDIWNAASDTGYDAVESSGILRVDPLYADAANHDYRLRVTSPLVDAGDNARAAFDAWAMPNDLDLRGKARIVDGDGDDVPTIDFGAIEFAYGDNTAPTFLTGKPRTHIFEGDEVDFPVFVSPSVPDSVTASVAYGTNLLGGPSSIAIAPGATNQLRVVAGSLGESVSTWVSLEDTADPAGVAPGLFAVTIHPRKVDVSVGTTTFLPSNAVQEVAISLPGSSRAPADLPLAWAVESGAANNAVEWTGDPSPAIPQGANAANGTLRVTGSSGATTVRLTVGGGYVFSASGMDSIVLAFLAHPGYLFVSPAGSDIHGDGSLGNPMQTMAAAMAALDNGQEVRLLPGTYDSSTQTFPIAMKSVTVSGCDTNGMVEGAAPLVTVDGGDAVARLFDCRALAGGATFRELTLARATASAIYAEHTVVNATNCVFTANHGPYTTGNDEGNAACIALVNNSSARIHGCTFDGNRGRGTVGGERREAYNDMTIVASNCVWRANDSRIGAVYLRHHVAGCWMDLSDCVFSNNTANTGYVDGGHGSSVGYTTSANGNFIYQTYRRCAFYDNSGASLFGTGYTGLTIADSLFAGNTPSAAMAGGVTYTLSSANNTFVHNSGAMTCFGPNSGSIFFRNTIIADPLSALWAQGNGTQPVLDNVLFWKADGAFAAETIGPGPGSSNVSTNNPKFVRFPSPYSSAQLDARLRTRTSPAFNGGDNAYASSLDLDRNARILDGVVDLGCYEYLYGDVEDPIYKTAAARLYILSGSSAALPLWVEPSVAYDAVADVAFGTNILSGAASATVPAGGTNTFTIAAASGETAVVETTVTFTDSDGAIESLVLPVTISPKRVLATAAPVNLLAGGATQDVVFSLPGGIPAPADIAIGWQVVEGGFHNVLEWVGDTPAAIEAGDNEANGVLRVTGGEGKTVVRLDIGAGFVFDASGEAGLDVAFIAHPGHLYVSPDGSDETGDGSLANPVRTIRFAVEGLAAGQEARLLPGTYAGAAQAFPIALKPVSIVGCNAAGAPAAGHAVLDGEGVAARLFTALDLASAPILRNLELRRAASSAVYADGSAVRVEGCVFRENSGTTDVLHNIGYAAGISLVRAASAVLSDSLFEGNHGRGAVGCDRVGDHYSHSSIVASNCVFRANTNAIGAVYLRHHDASCFIDLTGCDFVGNATLAAGTDGSAPCAAVFVTSATGARPGCAIRRTRFADNAGGHLLGFSYCNGDVRDCVFTGNATVGGSGTPPCLVGGTYVAVDFANNTLAANTGAVLGGTLNNECRLRNSVFADTGILLDNRQNTTPTLSHSLVWNSDGEYPPAVTQYYDGSIQRTRYDYFAAGWNLSTNDPLFASMPSPFSSAAFDGRPKNRKSPMLDAGDNGFVGAGDLDFAGNVRIRDGTVDLGAYEVPRASLPGDGTLLFLR